MSKKFNLSKMQITLFLLVVYVAFLVKASKLKKIQSLTIQTSSNNSNLNDTSLTNRNRRQICNSWIISILSWNFLSYKIFVFIKLLVIQIHATQARAMTFNQLILKLACFIVYVHQVTLGLNVKEVHILTYLKLN